MLLNAVAAAAFFGRALAQGVGNYQTETHPRLTWQRCTGTGGRSCTNVNGEIVLDANWRWTHIQGDYTNCYTGNEWNSTVCSNNRQCSQQCVLEGADYSGTYGITTSGNQLNIRFTTEHDYGVNVGARTYLMESQSRYQMFTLLGNEFTFDVDVSQLACGLNGALYFVNMPAGGHGTAGARYGTGYCDSQCPRDLKYINGQANAEGWQPSDSDPNAGVGNRGSCCAEMDIWEANSISNAYTPHPCDTSTFTECTGEQCGGTYSDDRYAGTCDPNGCDFNAYRVGVTDFYGPGMTIDTNQRMTVVTQFLQSGGTLSEIRRFYVQNGRVIANPQPTIPGFPGNSLTQEWCDAEERIFQERDYPFNDHGGMRQMSDAVRQGMVLVMSLWDDHYAHMLWLDSNYPANADPGQPGVARGTCPTSSGEPDQVESEHGDATVIFSNIRFGPIGSTFDQSAVGRG